MPKNAFFSTNSRFSDQPQNDAKTLFVHPPSPFHGNFCNCNSIGICTASQFYFQLPLLYIAWSNAYSEIGPEVRCNLSQLLSRKITKRIHSSKPASLNRPISVGYYVTSYSCHVVHSWRLQPQTERWNWLMLMGDHWWTFSKLWWTSPNKFSTRVT